MKSFLRLDLALIFLTGVIAGTALFDWARAHRPTPPTPGGMPEVIIWKAGAEGTVRYQGLLLARRWDGTECWFRHGTNALGVTLEDWHRAVLVHPEDYLKLPH